MRDPKKVQEARQRWYATNRDSEISKAKQRTKEYRQRNKDYIREIKDKPCMDCNIKFFHVGMDFDHVRGQKISDIARLAHKPVGLKKLKEEIAKCDLVCAVCHRIRTHKRSLEQA